MFGRCLIATTTLVILASCSPDTGDVRPPANSESPSRPAAPQVSQTPGSTPEPQYDRIFNKIRKQFARNLYLSNPFWRSKITFLAETNNEPTLSVERHLPPCSKSGPWPIYAVDEEVLAYTEGIEQVGRYQVTRQLTLYPDSTVAEAFLAEMENLVVCEKIDGRAQVGYQISDFTTDRFFRTREPRTTLFSESSYMFPDGGIVLYVDSVVRRGNAIMYTRVLDPSFRYIKGFGVMDGKGKHKEFVDAMRSQTNAGISVLDQL